MKAIPTLQLVACLFCLFTASFNAQGQVIGFDLPHTNPCALRLPNADLLLSSDFRTFPGNELACLQLDTAGQVVQEATLRLAGETLLHSSTLLADGRTALVGSTYHNGDYRPYTLLYQGGAFGDLMMWEAAAGGGFMGGVALPDSGYVALGSHGITNTRRIGLAVRIDKAGDTVWTRSYDQLGASFELIDGVALPGGGILVVGEYEHQLFAGKELVTARLSETGAIVWIRRQATNGYVQPGEVIMDAQHRLYISMYTYAGTSGSSTRLGVVAVDTLGTFLWSTLLDGYMDFAIGGITLRGDGLPVLMGTYLASPQTNWMGFLATLDSSGTLQAVSGYAFPARTVAHAAFLTQGGQSLVVATEDYMPLSTKLLFTDAQGTLTASACGAQQPVLSTLPLAFTTHPMEPIEQAGMAPSLHTGVAVADTVAHQQECSPPTSTAAPVAGPSAQVIPHPLRTASRITCPGVLPGVPLQLRLTDLQGRLLQSRAEPCIDGLLLHRDELPAGLYSYQVLQDGQRIASGKLWVAD